MEGSAVLLLRPGVFLGSGRVTVWGDGAPFYSFDKGAPFLFTLPAGQYTVEGAAKVCDYVPPDALRHRGPFPRVPRKLRVVFSPNPNKCSIHVGRGLIVCDPSMKSFGRSGLTFILFHEIGHYLHNGAVTPEGKEAQERACDAFAAREMMARGWNPSQVAIAAQQTLSACSQGRKDEQWNVMRSARHV